MDKTLDRAWLLMQSNRFDRSEQEIRKHLSENPDDPRAHTMLATCLFDLSRHDDAIESAKKAIELVPENPYPYWVLGCIYLNIHNLNLAEQYLLEAVKIDPNYSHFHAALSRLYWQQGRCKAKYSPEWKESFERGVDAAYKGLSIDPDNHDNLFYLIKNLLAFEDKMHFPKAMDSAIHLVSLMPENAEAHEIYAEVLICSLMGKRKRKDIDRILAIIEESLRLNPLSISSKKLAWNLLRSYYQLIPRTLSLITFLHVITFCALPLLILNSCFYYHNHDWQFYLTKFSLAATLLGLALFLEKSYIQLRIWLNLKHRKFLISNNILKIFWLSLPAVFTVSFLIGKFLPLWFVSILNSVVWFYLAITFFCLFALLALQLLLLMKLTETIEI